MSTTLNCIEQKSLCRRATCYEQSEERGKKLQAATRASKHGVVMYVYSTGTCSVTLQTVSNTCRRRKSIVNPAVSFALVDSLRALLFVAYLYQLSFRHL